MPVRSGAGWVFGGFDAGVDEEAVGALADEKAVGALADEEAETGGGAAMLPSGASPDPSARAFASSADD